MQEIQFEVFVSDDGGFEAAALGYPIFTGAESWPKLKEMAKDAVHCHFEGRPKPKVIVLKLVKEEAFALESPEP